MRLNVLRRLMCDTSPPRDVRHALKLGAAGRGTRTHRAAQVSQSSLR